MTKQQQREIEARNDLANHSAPHLIVLGKVEHDADAIFKCTCGSIGRSAVEQYGTDLEAQCWTCLEWFRIAP